MKSWILGAILLVAVGVGGGVLLLSQNLDEIVRAAIESQGSAALGTAVRVGSVELELAEGRGRIRDLRIANPPGSGTGNLLELGVVTLAIDATSALAVARGNSRHFIIERVSLEEPRAALVVAADGSTNVQALQDAMADGSSKDSSSSAQTEPLLLTLKSVSMERAAVRVDTNEIDGKQRDLALPDFSMRNVGGGRGRPAEEVGVAVAKGFAKRLTAAVAAEVAATQLDKVIDKRLGGDAGKAAKGLLKQVLGGN